MNPIPDQFEALFAAVGVIACVIGLTHLPQWLKWEYPEMYYTLRTFLRKVTLQ